MTSALTLRLHPGPLAVGVGVVGLSFAAATSAPLLTYSLGLASFGVAHVLWELRYVRRRFGDRLLGGLLLWTVLGLTGIVGVRLGYLSGRLDPLTGTQVELVLVGLLALGTAPVLARAGVQRALIGVTVVSAIALGVLEAPIVTLVTLAFLHNLTPVGFVAEALGGRERRIALAVCAVLFLALPAVIGSGWPSSMLARLGGFAPELTVLSTGPLSQQLGAYLPPPLHDWPSATALFSAAVFLQCMHYLAVLHVLPRLEGPSLEPPRLDGRVFATLTVALSLVFALGYTLDFTEARAWYGLMAAVHAWLEVPVLLLALGVRPPASPSPAA